MKPWRTRGWLLLMVTLLLGAIGLGIMQGTISLPPGRVVRVLLAWAGLPVASDAAPWERTILIDTRLPRVILAALVGSGLALSGAALQSVFRNPLADPGVLGVSSGASLGATLAIYLGFAARSPWLLPTFACAGAALSLLFVYAIATRVGRVSLPVLLLAGIAVGQLTAAATSCFLSLALANWDVGRQVLLWLLGGLEGRTWDHVRLAAPLLLGASFVLLAHGRDLDALLLGETSAVAVGVDVPRVRRRMILATAVMTGTSVAVGGSIAFVGLVIPHAMRLLVGPRHQLLLPACVSAGATFLVLADVLARRLIAPEEIRLGVITAAVGAPLFLFLLVRRVPHAEQG